MTIVSVLFAVLFYLATLVMVVGLAYRINDYARIPAPLKIPVTPSPSSMTGVVLLMAREVFFFESLFKASLWTWLFGWLFHAGLALVLLRHLRYFIDPIWFWVALLQPFGIYAGLVMAIGLGGLWARRFFVDRVRYISTPSDHLMLAWLLGIAISGLSMTFIFNTDVIGVKNFFRGLMYFDLHALPADWILYLHLLMVAFLMIIAPFSKLLHAPGLFFSPSRNQIDNSRDKRHLSTWAKTLESRGKK